MIQHTSNQLILCVKNNIEMIMSPKMSVNRDGLSRREPFKQVDSSGFFGTTVCSSKNVLEPRDCVSARSKSVVTLFLLLWCDLSLIAAPLSYCCYVGRSNSMCLQYRRGCSFKTAVSAPQFQHRSFRTAVSGPQS